MKERHYMNTCDKRKPACDSQLDCHIKVSVNVQNKSMTDHSIFTISILISNLVKQEISSQAYSTSSRGERHICMPFRINVAGRASLYNTHDTNNSPFQSGLQILDPFAKLVHFLLPAARLLPVLFQIPVHTQLQVKVQPVVDFFSLLRILVVMESRQFQNQNGREASEERLLLHVHVKGGRVQTVMKVGVTSHLDRVCSKVRLVDKWLPVADAFRAIVAVK